MSAALQPGEINLGLIPLDWPLTPIGDKKNPYIQGWQNKPFTVEDVGKELEQGPCKSCWSDWWAGLQRTVWSGLG